MINVIITRLLTGCLQGKGRSLLQSPSRYWDPNLRRLSVVTLSVWEHLNLLALIYPLWRCVPRSRSEVLRTNCSREKFLAKRVSKLKMLLQFSFCVLRTFFWLKREGRTITIYLITILVYVKNVKMYKKKVITSCVPLNASIKRNIILSICEFAHESSF